VTAATGVVALAVGYGLAALIGPAPAPEPSVEFTLRADTSHVMVSPCCGHAIAVSPQGDRIVYLAAGSDRVVRLYQRPLGQRQATAIPGTEGGRYPFFSPDGEWVGFFDTRSGVTMKKVRFDGAAPLAVTTIPAPHRGASWGDDGEIYFTHRGVTDLLEVSANGGELSTVAVADTTVEYTLGWPDVLPGSAHVLVSVMENAGDDALRNAVHIVDLASGERTPLIQNATDPHYVEAGYITFADGAGSIMAQEFDARTLELSGERFRIADRSIYRAEGQSEYDVSRTGTLVMLSGGAQIRGTELVMVDREGSSEVIDVGREARLPRFSPDGRYLAFEVYSSSEPSDIWVWDLQREVPTRVTFEGSNDHPSWSPDGASILFQRAAQGENHGYLKRRDGTGPATRVIDHVGRTPAFSPNGEWLIWATQPGGTTGAKIWVKEAENGEERELLGSGFPEFSPAISPDGRWLAYVAEDDGDDQVYVQSFPDLGPRVKISVEGGREPRWSPDGRELFFRDYASGSLISVEVLPGEGVFEPGAFRELFPTMNIHARVPSATNWDVHPDGERFVFVRAEGSGNAETGPERLVITHAVTRNR
jgi:serine/threonine-protein kinase